MSSLEGVNEPASENLSRVFKLNQHQTASPCAFLFLVPFLLILLPPQNFTVTPISSFASATTGDVLYSSGVVSSLTL